MRVEVDIAYLNTLTSHFRELGVVLDDGLSEAETQRIEATFGFRFPPDLRQVLQHVLPVSGPPPRETALVSHDGQTWEQVDVIHSKITFPDWRNGPHDELEYMLDRPADGICFDIEHNDFWMQEWGPRSPELADCLTLARAELAKVPTLIPVWAHRYIPSEPQCPGNPVFSVMQTDIIYYGSDLAWYFYNEFQVPLPEWSAEETRSIRFWDKLLV